MNRFVRTPLIALLTIILVACSFSGKGLSPADKIGGMELTRSFDKNLYELCDFTHLHYGKCVIPASASPIGISAGWAENSLDELDLTWLNSSWQMTIDDLPVNLPSFGTFDSVFGLQKSRMWRVGLKNLAPGEHTVQYKFEFKNGDDRGLHAETFTFTVVPADQSKSP